MSIKHSVFLGTAVLTLSWAASAVAAIVEWPLDRMAVESEVIVRGHVESLESRWLDGPSSIIVTDVVFVVDEVWKGTGRVASGATLALRVNGGKVGEIGMVQEHQPVFQEKEEAVIFLWTNDLGRTVIFNDEQGKYTVLGDKVIGFKQAPLDLGPFKTSIEQVVRSGKR